LADLELFELVDRVLVGVARAAFVSSSAQSHPLLAVFGEAFVRARCSKRL